MREWCEANGHTFVELCAEDEAVCGAEGLEGRLAFMRALDLVKTGEADAILVRDLDRLSRDVIVQESLSLHLDAPLELAENGTAGGLVSALVGPGEVCVQQRCCLFLVAGHQVAVAVERDADVGVAEVRAERLGVDTRGDHQRRERVPALVEDDRIELLPATTPPAPAW